MGNEKSTVYLLGQILGAILLIAVLVIAGLFAFGLIAGLMMLAVLGWSLKWLIRW